MFRHEKQLLHDVKIDKPDRNYAAMMQEQLGGPHGEPKAAMQYLSQSFRVNDPQIKDLFMDVASEELGHMEMAAACVNLLNGHTLVTGDSKLYFDLSKPGEQYFSSNNAKPPQFTSPN